MYIKLIGHFRAPKSLTFKLGTKYKTFLVKMSLICMRIKNQFHINDFARSLALKQRLEAIIKRPIHFWILLNFNSWGCALASRAWWPLAPNFCSWVTQGVH